MFSWICLPVGLPSRVDELNNFVIQDIGRVGVYSDMLRIRGGKVESPVKQSWI